jgi:hypothetical protein
MTEGKEENTIAFGWLKGREIWCFLKGKITIKIILNY